MRAHCFCGGEQQAQQQAAGSESSSGVITNFVSVLLVLISSGDEMLRAIAATRQAAAVGHVVGRGSAARGFRSTSAALQDIIGACRVHVHVGRVQPAVDLAADAWGTPVIAPGDGRLPPRGG
jgi:hypothetical protein